MRLRIIKKKDKSVDQVSETSGSIARLQHMGGAAIERAHPRPTHGGIQDPAFERAQTVDPNGESGNENDSGRSFPTSRGN